MAALTVVGTHPFVEESIRVLADNGYRITAPRSAVLKCLAVTNKPLSPAELLKAVQGVKGGQKVDRVSVYRILEVLLQNHLVHQVGPEGKYLRCAHIHCESLNHVILVCTECGSTEEHHLPAKLLKDTFSYLQSSLKFSPTAHHFQINGLCKGCAS